MHSNVAERFQINNPHVQFNMPLYKQTSKQTKKQGILQGVSYVFSF